MAFGTRTVGDGNGGTFSARMAGVSGANDSPAPVLSDMAGAEVLGQVTASPVQYTLLDRLKALLTGIVLAAGSNIIGKVSLVDSLGVDVDPNAVVPVSQSGSPWTIQLSNNSNPSYSAAITGLVPAAAATDILTIIGSATKIVYITRIQVSGVATAAAAVDLQLIKRSTADTAGTSTTPTAVPNDSANAAATAACKAYTANPTLGTLVGLIRSQKITLSTSAGAIPIVQTLFDVSTNGGQAITLRGIAEQLALNFNGQTVTGNSLNVDIEWYEK